MGKIWVHAGGRLGNQLFQLAAAHQLKLAYDSQVNYFSDSIHGDFEYNARFFEFMSRCRHVNGIYRSEIRGRCVQLSDFLYSRNRFLFKLNNHLFKICRSMNAFTTLSLPVNEPRIVTGFFINLETLYKTEHFVEELLEFLRNIEIGPEHRITGPYQLIHVRGTDFKGSVYGSLSSSYYESLPLIDEPIYVLTDDVNQAKQVMNGMEVNAFFGPSQLDAWQALALMSTSKRLFTSNSILSWWGAYLASSNGCEVFLPRPFYRLNQEVDQALYKHSFNYVQSYFEEVL